MAAIYKIVFAGPSGAGKTEAIHTLSDDEVLSKEAAVYSPGQAGPSSTVALDRGFVTLDNGDQLHLHGTSGHTGVDAMCGIVTAGSMGIVLNHPLHKRVGDISSEFAVGPLSDVPVYQGGPVARGPGG